MAVICALCCKKMVRIQERTNVNIRPVLIILLLFPDGLQHFPVQRSGKEQVRFQHRKKRCQGHIQEIQVDKGLHFLRQRYDPKNAIEKSHKTGDKTCNGQNSCSTDESALSGHNRLLYI